MMSRVQKSIVVDDLSPLAMYALRKASLVPQSAARSARDLDEDAAHGRTAAAAAAADNTHQVLLTDDDIKVISRSHCCEATCSNISAFTSGMRSPQNFQGPVAKFCRW